MNEKIPLKRQREVAWEDFVARQRAYPARVEAGTMKLSESTLRIAEMRAVFDSIDKLYSLEQVSIEMIREEEERAEALKADKK